jgi:hypothetical protein
VSTIPITASPRIVKMTTAPLVGEPLAFGIGFAVLVTYAFAKSWTESMVTVAHEGGHMATLALTGRGHRGFELNEGRDRAGSAATEGGTDPIDTGFGVGWWMSVFAGYATPPLAGLAGAHALADGNGWGVLWAGIVLLAVALLWANNAFARAVTALGLVGVLWVAIAGGPRTQAAVAFALVWLLLIGGAAQAVGDRGGSDGRKMAASTWIPEWVWWALWSAIAAICLWSGARLLLHFR